MEFDNILGLLIGIPVAVCGSYYILLGDYWSLKQVVIRAGGLGIVTAFGLALLDQQVVHFGQGDGRLFLEALDILPIAILTVSFILAEVIMFRNRRRRQILSRASRYAGR